MKTSHSRISLAALLALAALTSAAHAQTVPSQKSGNTVTGPDGQQYTFEKTLQNGQIVTTVRGPDGKVIPEASIPVKPHRVIHEALQEKLDRPASRPDYMDNVKRIPVVVALKLPPPEADPLEHGSAEGINGQEKSYVLNGKPLRGDSAAIAAVQKQTQERIAKRVKNAADYNAQQWKVLAGRSGFAQTAEMTRGDHSAVMQVTRAEINALSAQNDLIYELAEPRQAVNASDKYLASTRLDATVTNATNRGTGVGIFMGEMGCPANGTLPMYTLIGGASASTKHLAHSTRVGRIIQAITPSAALYCRSVDGISGIATTSAGAAMAPAVMVENHSWARYLTSASDNAYSAQDPSFDYQTWTDKIIRVVAAGNTCDAVDEANNGFGATCLVTTPGRSYNAITVGACDDASNYMTGFSAFLDPSGTQMKPEGMAPGVDMEGVTGANGTSFAAPMVAGELRMLMG